MTRRAAWVLGSILIGMLACAPARTTTAPLAMTTDIAVDVGRGQSLRIGERGKVTLDDVALQPFEDDDWVVGYHVDVTGDDVTLTLGLSQGEASRVMSFRVMQIDLNARRVRWDSIVMAGLGLDDEPMGFRVVMAGNRMVIVEGGTVVAIDTRTGAQAWAFDRLLPELDREYVEQIMPRIVTFDIEQARLRGRRLVLSARLRDERALSMLEIDVDTGRRVYVESRRDAPAVTGLAAFTRRVFDVPDAGNGQTQAASIPLHIEGWDGMAVGTTLLVWNVDTQRGLIVNPMHDSLAEVLERAQALPVEWMGVVHTKALADAIGESGMTFSLATKPSPAHFLCKFMAASSLDFVDAAALARSLGVPAITTPQALPKDMTVLYEYPDDDATIRFVWGPFAFEESSRPRDFEHHVTQL